MRPGDRKQRWEQACFIEGVVLLGFGGAITWNATGWPAVMIGGFFLVFAFLAFRSGYMGWPLREDLSPWANKSDNAGDLNG